MFSSSSSFSIYYPGVPFLDLPNYRHSPLYSNPATVQSASRDYSVEATLEAQGEGARSAADVSAPLLSAAKKVGDELYPGLRARAFDERENAEFGETPAAMKQLYRFWFRCLPDKFNVRMYKDFRSSSLEDARGDSPSDFGLQYLVRYYSLVLTDPVGPKPYPSVFVSHFTEARELLESWKVASG